MPQLCPVTKLVRCSPILDVAHYHFPNVILHQVIHIGIWLCAWLY